MAHCDNISAASSIKSATRNGFFEHHYVTGGKSEGNGVHLLRLRLLELGRDDPVVTGHDKTSFGLVFHAGATGKGAAKRVYGRRTLGCQQDPLLKVGQLRGEVLENTRPRQFQETKRVSRSDLTNNRGGIRLGQRQARLPPHLAHKPPQKTSPSHFRIVPRLGDHNPTI